MNAFVFYYVESVEYTDDSKSGWYLIRATLVDDRGLGLDRGAIRDRVPVARIHDISEAQQLRDAAAHGQFVIMPPDWKIVDVAKRVK